MTIGSLSPWEEGSGYRLVSGDGINDADNDKFTIKKYSSYYFNLYTNYIFTDSDPKKLSILIERKDSKDETTQKAFSLYLSDNNGPSYIELDRHEIQAPLMADEDVALLDLIQEYPGAATFSLKQGDGNNDRDNQKFAIEGSYLKAKEAIDHAIPESFHLLIQATENNDILTEPGIFNTIEGYTTTIENLYGLLKQPNEDQYKKMIQIYGARNINFGSLDYVRMHWNLQQLPTDEALCTWGDPGINELNACTWNPKNPLTGTMFRYLYFMIAYCNEIISFDQQSDHSSFTQSQLNECNVIVAETRFIRAFAYLNILDYFGSGPILSEQYKTGAKFPEDKTGAELFSYIESELFTAVNTLPTPDKSSYGRANKAVAQMLLSKLYLNAEVYTGNSHFSEALTYAQQVINNDNYKLDDNYANLFLADNHNSPEMIFPIINNGHEHGSYGSTTFIIYASRNQEMGNDDNSFYNGWSGIRSLKNLPEAFGLTATNFAADYTGSPDDSRAIFYFNPSSWSWDATNWTTFKNGIGVTKFKNINSDGTIPADAGTGFVSTDFPLMRLAEAYLIAAEAAYHLDDIEYAAHNINILRVRAGVAPIDDANINLDFILEERMRELYWEAHRRTDLIRFGKFTGDDYVWEWKGGILEGSAIGDERKTFLKPTEYFPNNSLTQAVEIKNNIAPTSLNQSKHSAITIIENPVDKELRINGLEELAQVYIYDLNGRLLMQKDVLQNKVWVGDLKQGIYLLKIKTDTSVTTIKIVKQ